MLRFIAATIELAECVVPETYTDVLFVVLFVVFVDVPEEPELFDPDDPEEDPILLSFVITLFALSYMSPRVLYTEPKLDNVVENEKFPSVLIEEFALSVLILRVSTCVPPVDKFPKSVPNGELLVLISVLFQFPVLELLSLIISPVVL